jgi:hypothetical protein
MVHHRFLENVLKEQQPQRGLIIGSRGFGRSMLRLTCGDECRNAHFPKISSIKEKQDKTKVR